MYLFILFYLFLAVLGLRCCTGCSLFAASRAHLLVARRRLLSEVPSRGAEHQL